MSLLQQLDALAEAKANELLIRAQQVISSSKLTATKELLNSLKVSVKKGTDKEPPVISLEYKDDGRFLDYKNPVWNKVPDLEKLKKWVAAKGVNSFRYVSGVGSTNISDEAKITKIASGVAWAKRKHSRWKAKGWKKRTLVAIVRKMNAEVIALWDEHVKQTLENALEGKK